MPISALIIDDEQLARDELKYLLDSIGGVDVVALGVNGIEAIDLIEEHQPDLVFLDVQMPGLDGFGVIRTLMDRRKSHPGDGPLPQVVFATAYDQYAVRAFEVNAVVERVRARVSAEPTGVNAAEPIESQLDTLLRLLKQPQASAKAAKLIVQAQSRLLLIDQAEICFAAIDEGVIRIVTRNLEGLSKCRTLEELMEQLDPAHFWRAHRGFVVNIDHIREVVPWFKSSYQLRMNDKQQTEIPVSRAQTRRLK
jgi:two-component system response regulator LytT